MKLNHERSIEVNITLKESKAVDQTRSRKHSLKIHESKLTFSKTYGSTTYSCKFS